MILSWLTSTGNNIVDKTKNPFLGTFTLVWLARNWELVFALFNFDKSFTLEKKIEFLSERIQYETFWTEVGRNVFWTFIVLILTYLLINIARAISNLFEKRLTPIIYKLTDYNSLVPKSEYQGALTRMNDLQERLDKAIQKKVKLQGERDKLEEEVNQLRIDLIDLNPESPDENVRKMIDAISKKDRSEKLEEPIIPELEDPEEETEEEFFRRIVNENSYKKLDIFCAKIFNGEFINRVNYKNLIEEFTYNDYILLDEVKGDERKFMFTEEGEDFVNTYLRKK